jgi:hypothetical protein
MIPSGGRQTGCESAEATMKSSTCGEKLYLSVSYRRGFDDCNQPHAVPNRR